MTNNRDNCKNNKNNMKKNIANNKIENTQPVWQIITKMTRGIADDLSAIRRKKHAVDLLLFASLFPSYSFGMERKYSLFLFQRLSGTQ